MKLFNNYLDPTISLIDRLAKVFSELKFKEEQSQAIISFLQPLKLKDEMTYEHSLRVGLLSRNIGQFMHLDQKPLLYAGLLHDIGKTLSKPQTLKKVELFTANDYEEIRNHVKDGYKMLRGYFDFTAEVIVWHHRFQKNNYPKKMPSKLHDYEEATKAIIPMYGRLVSLADCFDALHRVNKKSGETRSLSGEEIKEQMLIINYDQKNLVAELYEEEIFTTRIIN